MLALRRASLTLRGRVPSIRVSSVICCNTEQLVSQTRDRAHGHALFPLSRGLASRAGTKAKAGLENGFSDLEADESASEDEATEVSASQGEGGATSKRRQPSLLLRSIRTARISSVREVLDKWVRDGNVIDRDEISLIFSTLRKLHMDVKALQFSEWLESSKSIEFTEKDHVSRLRLIGKLHGQMRAEKYINTVPKPFKGQMLYQTYLTICTQTLSLKKAEETYEKIKNEFTLTDFACNQMILLYKKSEKWKIADVLASMEEKGVKPTMFTYGLLVDAKVHQGDVPGMEQILERMKTDGVEPDTYIKYCVAKQYCLAGDKEKAEAITKEIEGENLEENREAWATVIRLYGELGRAEDVTRAWKICEKVGPWPMEYQAAIDTWGKLEMVEKAEEVFEQMVAPSSSHFNALLRLYVGRKMMDKGTALIKLMAGKGLEIGPVTWDLLVRLYVEAGEVERADTVLHRAGQRNAGRAMISSYMSVMDAYARKGDTHNTEKMFLRLKEAGYLPRLHQFQTLVKAYVNAKVPFYGAKERLKADNVVPSNGLSGQLELVNPFKKTSVSDLLD